MTGHWSCIWCTPRHLVDLYQASLNENGKGIETNNVNDPFDSINGINTSHLDVSDFFEDSVGNIDLFGNVLKN